MVQVGARRVREVQTVNFRKMAALVLIVTWVSLVALDPRGATLDHLHLLGRRVALLALLRRLGAAAKLLGARSDLASADTPS